MVEAPSHRPFYAFAAVPGFDVRAHAPRAQQSAAAADLLSDLRMARGVQEGPSSKSHSRGLAAAAVQAAGALGIDLEFMRPGRPGGRILALYMKGFAPEVDDEGFYRTWTFGEAHFKAFGANPSPELLHRFLATPLIHDVTYRLTEEISVLHARPAPDFMLSLVWTAGAP